MHWILAKLVLIACIVAMIFIGVRELSGVKGVQDIKDKVVGPANFYESPNPDGFKTGDVLDNLGEKVKDMVPKSRQQKTQTIKMEGEKDVKRMSVVTDGQRDHACFYPDIESCQKN